MSKKPEKAAPKAESKAETDAHAADAHEAVWPVVQRRLQLAQRHSFPSLVMR